MYSYDCECCDRLNDCPGLAPLPFRRSLVGRFGVNVLSMAKHVARLVGFLIVFWRDESGNRVNHTVGTMLFPLAIIMNRLDLLDT